jgi:hypothetical protein
VLRHAGLPPRRPRPRDRRLHALPHRPRCPAEPCESIYC